MKHLIMKLLCISVLLICVSFVSAQNENGGVRISFGNDAEYVEPKTLSGDDPAVPAKPKRHFSTNSIILNQILESCDEGYESFNTTFEKLQNRGKVVLGNDDNHADCFAVVYNLESKKIVAVMDKGFGKRMNLLDNQFEKDDLYPQETFGRIFFLIEE